MYTKAFGIDGLNDPSKRSKYLLSPPTSPLTSLPPIDTLTSLCLNEKTFVFTGVLKNLTRDRAVDYVRALGGRVMKNVSSRTDYLVCGRNLEDGRDVKQGIKYLYAVEKGVQLVEDSGIFYSLIKLYSDKMKNVDKTNENLRTVIPSNPYAKSSRAFSTISTPSAPSKSNIKIEKKIKNKLTSLWTDKYAPSSVKDLLGNGECVRKLTTWLNQWEKIFREKNGSYSLHGPFKAALLSGPPGIGKTTSALLIAKSVGRVVLELNASDTRSQLHLKEGLGDVTGSKVLSFTSGKTERQRCIIMDEVDGMGAGDRSGISQLIQMIKRTKVPIICICNDRQSMKLKSLISYCLDLRYRRPTKGIIARRAIEVCHKEGFFIEPNAAEIIVEMCGNDVRQVLHVLQMWVSQSSHDKMTYKEVKKRQSTVNKDEILRWSIFDATRALIEGRKGLTSDVKHIDTKTEISSFLQRNDAFFVDYSLMGLLVHQNYIKVILPQYQQTLVNSNIDEGLTIMERLYQATNSMSDYAMAEHTVRSNDQLWEFLPLCAILTIQTGYFASGQSGGYLSGYPEFPSWMGKNSSRGKKSRLLKELAHHMNYSISTGNADLRMAYLPALRERFCELLFNTEYETNIQEAIVLMDDYGLDRDDIMENLDEFTLDVKGKKFNRLGSKVKRFFTNEYNKRTHKSQALINEQGSSKTSYGKKTRKENEGHEKYLGEEEEKSESEDDIDLIGKLFQSKGKKKKLIVGHLPRKNSGKKKKMN